MNALTAALARSEGRQREFLLSISHELRTPLTAVTGHAEALADGVIEGDDARAAGAVMLSEAHRLNRLVSDLLDLARLGADDFRIDLAPTDLTALVRGAEQVWRPRCEAEGIELRLELPPGPLMIVTDGGRVRQILDGLAENALRVVPQGAPIVFAVGPDPVYAGYAVLQVRDGGPGPHPGGLRGGLRAVHALRALPRHPARRHRARAGAGRRARGCARGQRRRRTGSRRRRRVHDPASVRRHAEPIRRVTFGPRNPISRRRIHASFNKLYYLA